jgi:hypothetical protein
MSSKKPLDRDDKGAIGSGFLVAMAYVACYNLAIFPALMVVLQKNKKHRIDRRVAIR